MSEAGTMLQVDLLHRFGFPEFTFEFLEGLKSEIPRYRRMARVHFDWKALDGATEYDDTSSAPIVVGRMARFWKKSSFLENMSKKKGLTGIE